MKSTRKNKNCRVSTHSVGIKDKVTTQCPPDLTDSVKEALLKEIAEFDATKAKQDAEVSANGGPTIDAYQDWLGHNEGHEPIEANPDSVSDRNGINYITSKKDSKMANLLKEFRQSLTARELQVWNLIMKHQLSYSEASKLLNITQSALETYLKRAKTKFGKFTEAIKRA